MPTMVSSVHFSAVSLRTGIVFDADALQATLNARHGSKRRNNPAVAKTALLDVVSAYLVHESRLLVDLMDALDRLGDHSARAQKRGASELKLGRAKIVQAVAFLVFEIPVLGVC